MRLAPFLLAVPVLMAASAAAAQTPGRASAAPVVEKDADIEKRLRGELRDGLRQREPGDRVEAVNTYGRSTRSLEDEGSSRLVAKTLAGALDDDELAVRAAALTELSWGRDPATVLDILEDQLDELRGEIEKLWTRTDEESRARRNDATRLFSLTCQILGRHRDDRAVEVVSDELKKLRRGTGPGNAVQILIQPLAQALLAQGSHASVEAVIKTTDVYSGNVLSRGRGRVTAERLHDALAEFAEDFGRAPPAFDDRYDQRWRTWWKENEAAFPTKLGKLKEPVARPEYERMDRRPYQRRAGKQERP